MIIDELRDALPGIKNMYLHGGGKKTVARADLIAPYFDHVITTLTKSEIFEFPGQAYIPYDKGAVLGDVGHDTLLAFGRGAIKLPFYQSCFVFKNVDQTDGKKANFIMICAETEDEGTFITPIVHDPARPSTPWWIAGLAYQIKLDETGSAVIQPHMSFVDISETTIRNHSSIVQIFMTTALSLLNENNTSLEKISRCEKANIRREKQGKNQLKDYHIVKLGHKQIGTRSDHGGTHASPRCHVRRGHTRQLPTQKITWVRPTIVGNPFNGFIDKRYIYEPDGE
jgi:hypothetical protein